MCGFRGWFVALALAWSCLAASGHARAQDPSAVIEVDYTPTARAQVAIWIETADGRFLSTVRLTEAVAFRGIGNRPGASEMNSGYRWPYGRREGVLPVWGRRRASAPGAQPFPRVVFQDRVEGLASRTTTDNSVDDYYCLSFAKSNSSRDALDAVSCASVFTSDKGRYITADDLALPYAEPYEDPGMHVGVMAALPATSLYPPRMDVERCTTSACYDSEDLARFASDARAVMPDIDAVTMATPPGDNAQSVLFSVPATWPKGQYVVWLEINVEGDYNSTWSASTYRTPVSPDGKWDSWAMEYGYPYRGQPSVVFKVPVTLAEVGDDEASTSEPVGHSSWDVWDPFFGTLFSEMSSISDDPSGAPGSGVDRLRRDAGGERLVVKTTVLSELPDPVVDTPGADGGVIDPGDPTQTAGEGGSAGAQGTGSGGGAANNGGGSGGTAGTGSKDPASDDSMKGHIIEDTGGGTEGPVGAIYDLELSHHEDELRAHTWINLQFRAARSDQPLHSYDVRVATQPIIDEETFIRNGREARNATDDSEGATLLMLPTEVKAGKVIESSIGDLVADTHYFVAVRATDRLNRHGPITVAEITTKKRVFATVTPCFIATAAYGTPLAAEVSVLREVRDRYLMTHAPGRALVAVYYAVGPRLASWVREHAWLRSGVRALLDPAVVVARRLLAP